MGKRREREDVMLAYKLTEGRLKRFSHMPVFIQPKINGFRCRACFDSTGRPVLYSSTGLESKVAPHINEAIVKPLKDLADYTDLGVELDGELQGQDFWDTTQLCAVNRLKPHPEHERIRFKVFDLKVEGLPQSARFECLGELDLEQPLMRVSTYWEPHPSITTILKWCENFISAGDEGVIIRSLTNFYECKRSLYMLKYKPREEGVFPIYGWQEEVSQKGEAKGRVGALAFIAENGEFFTAGSGLRWASREELWQRRDEIDNGELEAVIRYQELTPYGVPQFPVVIQVRKKEN